MLAGCCVVFAGHGAVVDGGDVRGVGVGEVLARSQRRRVDRLLQLTLGDVQASDVDDESCEPDQHDESERRQDERLTLLAPAPDDQEPRSGSHSMASVADTVSVHPGYRLMPRMVRSHPYVAAQSSPGRPGTSPTPVMHVSEPEKWVVMLPSVRVTEGDALPIACKIAGVQGFACHPATEGERPRTGPDGVGQRDVVVEHQPELQDRGQDEEQDRQDERELDESLPVLAAPGRPPAGSAAKGAEQCSLGAQTHRIIGMTSARVAVLPQQQL